MADSTGRARTDRTSGPGLPARAKVVIVGGGVIGASVAYHLGALGWHDTLLLERAAATSGTTWHAAGLVGQVRSHPSLTRLVQHSAALYARLAEETGVETGWRRCGSLSVARTQERMVQLGRSAAATRRAGVDCRIVDVEEARRMWPLMTAAGVVGAVHVPGDGRVNPVDLTMSLLAGARREGVTVLERVPVTRIVVEGGRARGVKTPLGTVECEVVVDCAGMWAPLVAEATGEAVPLCPAEHFYAVTEPLAGVHPDLPVLRDPDGFVYFREEVGGLVVGGFEPEAKPWAVDGPPADFSFSLLPEDWPHFSFLMERAVERVPALADVGIKMLYNGPESFTPDGGFLLGELAASPGAFVAAGFNSMGIASAGGAGWALANQIVTGRPPFDLWPVDPRRFATAHANRRYLADRVRESVGLHYSMAWPDRDYRTARGLRRSPVHHLVAAAGASWGTHSGWERAAFFAHDGVPPAEGHTWGLPAWLPSVHAEMDAAYRGVALFDDSSRAKLLVCGSDAAALLARLCMAEPPAAPGASLRTTVLGTDGRYRAAFEVVRLAADELLVLTGPAEAAKDRALLLGARHGARAEVIDVTAAYARFVLVGPRTDSVLAGRPGAHLAADEGERAGGRRVELGYSTGLATRGTIGHLPCASLLVAADQAAEAYEALLAHRGETGLVPAGAYALDWLEIEAGVRRWGRELTSDRTPFDASLEGEDPLRATRSFQGIEELLRLAGSPPAGVLHVVVAEDPSVMLWGGEVLVRDGLPVGSLTAACHSRLVGSATGLAYVDAGGASGCDATRPSDRGAVPELDLDLGVARCAVRLHRSPVADLVARGALAKAP